MDRATMQMDDVKVGDAVRIRTNPLRDCVLRVQEVDAHGMVTGVLLTRLVIEPMDYDLIPNSATT